MCITFRDACILQRKITKSKGGWQGLIPAKTQEDITYYIFRPFGFLWFFVGVKTSTYAFFT